MSNNRELLAWILRDWTARVLKDLEAARVVPIPRVIGKTIARAGRLVALLEGKDTEGDTDNPEDF
jgi:hypothetical protein